MILHTDDKAFLMNALDVLDAKGNDSDELIILGRELSGKVYADSVITIMKSADDQFMEIIRNSNRNSVFYIHDGITIRFNNEYVYLEKHVQDLLDA